MRSEHPLGKAIVRCYREEMDKEPSAPEAFSMLPGRGVRAVVEGKEVAAGNAQLLAEEAIEIPAEAQAAAAALVTGYAPDQAVRSRMQVYADATRLRLACVYACRPAEISLSPLLFAQVGRPLLLP